MKASKLLLLKAFDILTAARLLLDDKANWTKGAAARSKDGVDIEPKSLRATCWCAVGAVEATTSFPMARVLARYELDDACGGDVVTYNDRDSTRHPMILRRFDKAIENVAKKIDAV